MKNYILPQNLLPQWNALNVSTGRYCVPSGDGINLVVSIPDNYAEHLQFAVTNALAVSYYLLVSSDRAFCESFQNSLLQKLREDLTLTNTQRGTLLSTVQLGMNALSWGDAVVARTAFNSITTTALWTQTRKDWVLLQMDNYINSNS